MRRTWLLLLGVVLVLVSGFAVLAARARPIAHHPFFTEVGGRPLVIAHRGGAHLWPENTVYAFQRAAEQGADLLEMDIHSTADGVLVLLHDDTVDRTTDGTGSIRALSLQEVKALDAGFHWSPDGGRTFPYRGAGLTVPTLAEVFAALPGAGMNLEIKQREPSIVPELCRLVREHGLERRSLVASFHGSAVREFRRECPEVATSATVREATTFVLLGKVFRAPPYTPPAQALQLPERRGPLHVLTPGIVAAAQARNLQVHAWTIDEPEDMRRLLDVGVDGIVTDRPDRLLTLLGRSADR